MAPGSRHKGDFPKDAGSVGTRFTGHRAQHWVGVCRSEDLVGSAGDSSWQQQGSRNRVGVRSQTEEGVPPALRQVCWENTAGRPRTERPAVPARPLVASRSLSSHGEAEGSPCSTPSPGPVVGFGARPGKRGSHLWPQGRQPAAAQLLRGCVRAGPSKAHPSPHRRSHFRHCRPPLPPAVTIRSLPRSNPEAVPSTAGSWEGPCRCSSPDHLMPNLGGGGVHRRDRQGLSRAS